MRFPDFDLYDELGVRPEATSEEIRQAYRELARSSHPDKNPHAAQDEVDHFRRASQAYHILSNAEYRQAYDDECVRQTSGVVEIHVTMFGSGFNLAQTWVVIMEAIYGNKWQELCPGWCFWISQCLTWIYAHIWSKWAFYVLAVGMIVFVFVIAPSMI